MKITSLRIGNLVQDTVSGEWLRVDELNRSGQIVTFVLNRDKYPLPDGWKMGGIPLDQQILERCGMKFDAGRWSLGYEGGGDPRETFRFEFAGSHVQLLSKGYVGNPFQYLHELQNLFHALTGKELVIHSQV